MNSGEKPTESGREEGENPAGEARKWAEAEDATLLPDELARLQTEEEPTLAPDIHAGEPDPNVGLDSAARKRFFGDYEILEEIARGGMGVVYRARQRSLNRTIALKMILAGELASEDAVRRFYTEAEAAAKLDHPSIVPIFEIGTEDNTHYFSMKLITGSDLGKQLPRYRDDLRSAVIMMEKVCRAVHHAHLRGILHRDLKPANLLIDEQGEPFVTDLGVARKVGADSELTKTGAIVGTPSYMSPEQAGGRADITVATDIYSLGAILYEILCGKPPFQGASPLDTLMQVINEEPSRPSLNSSVDQGLELVALKCLSKNPTDRYASAESLADDLGRWLRGESLTIRAPSLYSMGKQWLQQNFGRAVWILVVGLACGLISGLGLWNATAQQEIDSRHAIYDELPSFEAPWSMMPFKVPNWMTVPCLFVFTIAIAYVGFFTAWLVRTKNRSADLAAGLMVGVISGASAFFICFGTLSIIALFDDQDLQSLAILANADLEETPRSVLNQYPEFEDMERAKQVDLLRNKIVADRLTRVPRGILVGALSCVFLYVLAGIVQTLVAGPLVRKYQHFGKSFGAYAFGAYHYIVATIVFGIHTGALLVLGDAGILWDGLMFALLATMVIGIISEVCRWKLVIRLALVGFAGCLFWYFFALNFPLIPMLAQRRVQARNAIALADKYPGDPYLVQNAAQAVNSVGVGLYRHQRYGFAIQQFDRAITLIEPLPREQWTLEIESLGRTLISNKASSLRASDRASEAEVLFTNAVESRPEDFQLREDAIQFLCSRAEFDSARRLTLELQISDPESWRQIRSLIFQVETSAARSQNTELESENYVSAVRDAIDRSGLAGQTMDRLRSSLRPQHWKIRHVPNTSQREMTLQQLLGKSKAERTDPQRIDLVDTSVLAPASVDLLAAFENAPEESCCYAVTSLTSDVDSPATFFLGSDDGATVWLNGEIVHENLTQRSHRVRQDMFSGQLRAGSNIVIVRVDQMGGRWQFSLEIEGEDGWPLDVKWDTP